MRPWLIAPLALLGGCRASIVSVGEYAPDSGHTLADASTPPHADASDASLPGFYLEAEDGTLSGGFTIESDAAASGGAFITGPPGALSDMEPGAARAVYRFDVPRSASYVVWGRIHSPDTAHNALWVRVDDGTWYAWRLSTGEDWYWGTFHDNVNYGVPLRFELARGSHEIDVANYADTVGLDRLFVTAGMDRPTGDDTPCHPPDSIRLGAVCVPSCGAQGGTTCGDMACTGRPPISAYDCVVCCVAP